MRVRRVELPAKVDEDDLVDSPYPDRKRERNLIDDCAVAWPVEYDHGWNNEGERGCEAIEKNLVGQGDRPRDEADPKGPIDNEERSRPKCKVL